MSCMLVPCKPLRAMQRLAASRMCRRRACCDSALSFGIDAACSPQTKRMIVLFAKQGKSRSQGRRGGWRRAVAEKTQTKPWCRPTPRAPRSQKGRQEERASAKKKGTSAAGFGAPSWNVDPAVEGKAKPDLARKRPPAACVPQDFMQGRDPDRAQPDRWQRCSRAGAPRAT